MLANVIGTLFLGISHGFILMAGSPQRASSYFVLILFQVFALNWAIQAFSGRQFLILKNRRDSFFDPQKSEFFRFSIGFIASSFVLIGYAMAIALIKKG